MSPFRSFLRTLPVVATALPACAASYVHSQDVSAKRFGSESARCEDLSSFDASDWQRTCSFGELRVSFVGGDLHGGRSSLGAVLRNSYDLTVGGLVYPLVINAVQTTPWSPLVFDHPVCENVEVFPRFADVDPASTPAAELGRFWVFTPLAHVQPKSIQSGIPSPFRGQLSPGVSDLRLRSFSLSFSHFDREDIYRLVPVKQKV